MSDVTNLKQADNKLEIAGILAEKDLHEGKNNNNNKKTIEGYVTFKIDELNQIRVRVSADETKKDGASNPAYENLVAFNQNASSIADVGAENASKIYTGSGQLNPYHSAQSNNDVLGYRTSFITVSNREEFEPKAQATVELYIKAIVPEVDKEGNETGRMLVKGWMPTYNGIEPLTLIAPVEDGIADSIGDVFQSGDTATFYADVINNRVEVVKEIPVRLGKPKIEKTVTYTNELIITGASEPYAEEKAYDKGAIQKAIQERDDHIKEAASKAQKPQNKPSGAAMGRSTKNW